MATMPDMDTFDSPMRDAACTRRQRTDTPLQASGSDERTVAAGGLAQTGGTRDSRILERRGAAGTISGESCSRAIGVRKKKTVLESALTKVPSDLLQGSSRPRLGC